VFGERKAQGLHPRGEREAAPLRELKHGLTPEQIMVRRAQLIPAIERPSSVGRDASVLRMHAMFRSGGATL
jgi:hypothetical protein